MRAVYPVTAAGILAATVTVVLLQSTPAAVAPRLPLPASVSSWKGPTR